MQSIKRLGKQLGFVVLTGSAMFSVSSLSAQVTPVKRETVIIRTNTDLIIDAAYLQNRFPGDRKLELVTIGGVHSSEPGKPGEPTILRLLSNTIFDPFVQNYGNSQKRLDSYIRTLNSTSESIPKGIEIKGTFSNVNSINPKLDFGIFPDDLDNPPALKLGEATNYGRCDFANCVLFHYGYEIEVTSRGPLNAKFDGSFYSVRNSLGRSLFERSLMVSPEIDPNPPGANFVPQENTPDEFLVVYSEQRNPEEQGVAIANWTQFPIKRGQTPTLRFTNSEANFDPITVSKTRVLRSATEIPLEQLTAADLPPTDPRFVPVPSADGIVAPDEVKPPVPVPGPITAVLKGITKFNGTSDFVEIPDNDDLNFGTGDLSISAWVKTSSSNGLEIILDKRVEDSGPIQGYSLVNNSGTLLLQLADGEGTQFTNYVSSILIADGNLHHVTVTVDRDQLDGGRWYIDGVEVVSQRFNPTRRGSLSNSKPLVIGKRSDNPGWPGFFNGEIGPVGITNRVLSPQEIQSIAAIRP